jgi:hypothetical protein
MRKVVIDASGDEDVVWKLRVPTKKGDEKRQIQSLALIFDRSMTKFFEVDPRLRKLEDFNYFIVEAHRRRIAILAVWAPYLIHSDHPYFQALRNPNHVDPAEFSG